MLFFILIVNAFRMLETPILLLLLSVLVLLLQDGCSVAANASKKLKDVLVTVEVCSHRRLFNTCT